MYNFLIHLHSGFRYIVLLLLIVAIIQSFAGWFGSGNYTSANKKINLFAMISVHTQLLIGLVLYFVSPLVNLTDIGSTMKDNTLRYWTVEHLVMMLFAIILITIGHSRSKKAAEGHEKHRAAAIFYTLGLIVIIVGIVLSQRPVIGFLQ